MSSLLAPTYTTMDRRDTGSTTVAHAGHFKSAFVSPPLELTKISLSVQRRADALFPGSDIVAPDALWGWGGAVLFKSWMEGEKEGKEEGEGCSSRPQSFCFFFLSPLLHQRRDGTAALR